jgi:hypothetical protein
MDTTENNLEKIRADVDLAEDKPTAPTVCNPGRQDSCKEFTRSPHPILKAQTEPEFEGRDAVRLTKKEEGERCEDNSTVPGKVVCLKTMLRMSKVTVMVTAMAILMATSLAGADTTKRKMI